MKAYLDFNGILHGVLDIDHIKPELFLNVYEKFSMHRMGDPSVMNTKKMVFQYKLQLNKHTVLYDFSHIE